MEFRFVINGYVPGMKTIPVGHRTGFSPVVAADCGGTKVRLSDRISNRQISESNMAGAPADPCGAFLFAVCLSAAL
jgi:hypothetical protein